MAMINNDDDSTPTDASGKTYAPPAERGFYRTLWSTRRGPAPVTLYVFENEQLGGWLFQFVGFEERQNSLPVPLSIFEGRLSRPWLGPFETQEEAEAVEPEA